MFSNVNYCRHFTMYRLSLWALSLFVVIGYGFSTPFEGDSLPVAIENRDDDENDQIVGGVPAAMGEFPFMVYLTKNNRFFCGGSLLTPNVVLTAAHCLYGSGSISTLNVNTNTLSLSGGGSTIVSAVKDILIHESYDPDTMDNDVALIALSTPINNVKTVKLPEESSTPSCYSGQQATIAGWGTTSSGGSVSTKLLKATVTVLTNEVCSKAYRGINDNKLCAAAPGKDTCQGDSGGPLFIGDVQIGITSYGRGCANARYPGVYARVTTYLDWINTNVENFN